MASVKPFICCSTNTTIQSPQFAVEFLWKNSRVGGTFLLMARYIVFCLTVLALTISAGFAFAQQNILDASGVAGPITGSVPIERLGTIRWSYHFDHNALIDAEIVGRNLVALTDSGNIVRFDVETLSITGHKIVPGRGIAIARGTAGKLLIGTENGKIFSLAPSTLALTRIVTTTGHVVWLSKGKVLGKPNSIVAIIDGYSRAFALPGESFEAYAKRSDKVERQNKDVLGVLIIAEGKLRYMPFKRGRFGTPNVFMLDNDRLWMGKDQGEWGGRYSYMELDSGKVQNVDTGSGILGFLKTRDGRVLAYGGTSHMGAEFGFVQDIGKAPAATLLKFEHMPERRPPKSQTQTKPTEDQDAPRSPIDFVFQNRADGKFLVLSAHDIFEYDRNFTKSKKIADFGGRGSGLRSYSVGYSPSVRKVLITDFGKPELIAISARDGLARFSNGKIKQSNVQGQIESSVVDIWPTSIGNIFFNDDYLHDGWRLDDDGWHRIRFYPDKPPSDTDEYWYEAMPILDDHGLIAYFEASSSPGEKGILKFDGQETTVLSTWTGPSLFFSVLGTSDGTILEMLSNGLGGWNGKGWEYAGTYSEPESGRYGLVKARRYVPLLEREGMTVFLDDQYGDLFRLTKSDGRYDFRPLTAPTKDPTPSSIFDAVADGDSHLLAASISGLFRFNPENGERERIPAPNSTEQFKTIIRDSSGRIWTAGDLLYVSVDDGKHWSVVRMPMLGQTFFKRMREISSGTIALTLYDCGVVFISGMQK